MKLWNFLDVSGWNFNWKGSFYFVTVVAGLLFGFIILWNYETFTLQTKEVDEIWS